MLTRTLSLRAATLLAGLALVACGTSTIPLEDTGPGPDTGPPPVDAGDVRTDAGPDMDTGPAPVCDPAATRIGECGFCGSQAQECDSAGQWMGTSDCLGEGECAFGTVETRDLAMCGQEQQLCLDGCVWGPWEETTPTGVCEAGATRTSADACAAGELRDEECSPTCEWVATSMCGDPCGGTARTTPEWNREVCVPAGIFVRGDEVLRETRPAADVYLSAYYIDAYPVTNRRYQECVSVGACGATRSPTYSLAAYLDYPVQGVTRMQAVDFCLWDGGRTLPTEAQWEKAGRGPAPRTNWFPWGSSRDCSRVYDSVCGFRWPDTENGWAKDPYDGLPATRSFYGTYLQGAGVSEFTSDYYLADYYSDPMSLTDPSVSAADVPAGTPLRYVLRGSTRETMTHLFIRIDRAPAWLRDNEGFRCARDAP